MNRLAGESRRRRAPNIGRSPRGCRRPSGSGRCPGTSRAGSARCTPAGLPKTRLADRGLPAYASHPLHRAVEIDRTYYEAPAAQFFRGLAEEVPDDFRFLVKAHEECTVFRFPTHARYGKRRGELNGRFLDAAYATDAVVGPTVEGLGDKAGPLLFQFPPAAARRARGLRRSAARFFAAAAARARLRGRAAQRRAVHARVRRRAARCRGAPLSQRLERDAAPPAAGAGDPAGRAAAAAGALAPARRRQLRGGRRALPAVRSPA